MAKMVRLTGAPGAGKTKKVLEDIIKRRDKFVYASPRIDLLEDAQEFLKRENYVGGMVAIFHDKSASKNVDQRIEDFVCSQAYHEKAVLLITHAALLTTNMSQFVGWHLIVDEVPSNAVFTDTLHCRASLPAVKELFSLHPDPDGRTDIMLMKARQGHVHDILDDRFLKPLANLWQRAQRGTVFVENGRLKGTATDTGDPWAEIARRHCAVVSVWSVDEFDPFESVTIAAAGLERSLVHLCNPRQYEDCVIERPASAASIRIHFFDQVTKAGSTFFVSEEGTHNLERIGTYLSGLQAPLGFWTCNAVVKDHMVSVMPVGYVSPMQAGSNRLRALVSCAAFYSAKKTPSDRLLCQAYKLKDEEIERAREWEHLAQFVMRGKPRDHDYAGRYDIFVYDKWQAERLASYLKTIGFPDTKVAFVKLKGIKAKAVRKKGRKAVFTKEEALERKRARDRAAYARKRLSLTKGVLAAYSRVADRA